VETEGGVMEIRPECDGHYKLRDQIAMLPTPQLRDYRGYARVNSESNYFMLNEEVGKNLGLKLQPAFVEWLMGFPLGWTDLSVSVTPSSPKSPSKSSRE
jgi:hypothetical protein